MSQQDLQLPLIPLRDVVVYPEMAATLLVGRDSSIAALDAAVEAGQQIVLLAQREAGKDNPKEEDLYDIGTIATVLRMLKLPEGPVKLLVEGEQRVQIQQVFDDESGEFLQATVSIIEEDHLPVEQSQLLADNLWTHFDTYTATESRKISDETRKSLESIDDLPRLIDTMVAHSGLDLAKKQEVLELIDVVDRIEYFIAAMDLEMELLQIDKRIRGRVKKQMEKSQREYYLNEQIKAIQKELGNDESPDDLAELKKQIVESGMPTDVQEKALTDCRKLGMMSPMSAEASVLRNYLDWMLKVPWKKRSKVRIDLNKAREILDADHYGLDEVKERILEFLAVQKRVKNNNGSILCLVGPPGVGKTSLGRSVAKATGRKFVRMALGGVRDEAEIRGHRRTYIGAMPGKIVQKMTKVEVKNPLFLLDEIDKMGMDHRGDPASALLEVLDPEQNKEFGDHYLEVDYDLSNVMFICTSNTMNIPGPLLDRMEIIRLSGYTEEEKFQIAKRHLLTRQIENNGLKTDEISVSDSVLRDIIRHYTREAGVRGLDRELSKLCRKVVFELVETSDKSKAAKKSAKPKTAKIVKITSKNLSNYLGPHQHKIGMAEKENQVGLVTGLAWTQVGGELLNIEAALTPGKGRYTSTGSLGDVMQESIKAAMTAVKARSQALGIPADFLEKHDLHIHMPEGATPKDGPSAGIGLATAVVSVLTNTKVISSVAMTGEVNLRGHVLKIGGLKEKLLAAHRGGIKQVLIPKENEADLQKVPDFVLKDMQVIPVSTIDEVFKTALERLPSALSDEEYALSVRGLRPQIPAEVAGEYVKTH